MDLHERTLYQAILITACLIGCCLIIFMAIMVRLHRRYVRLQQNRTEVEIAIVEKERLRIASDLHDDLGPLVSAIRFQLEEVEPATNEDHLLLEKSRKHLDHIHERLRVIAHDLLPAVLIRKGAADAIVAFIHAAQESFPVKINLTVNPLPPLSQQQSIQLFRMVQEIVHNTVRHARASKLDIHFFVKDKLVHLYGADDGCGFHEHIINNSRQSGRGLYQLFHRAELLGGSFYLTTSPGKGTSITITFPVKSIDTNE
jgi:signal transduction histidine kinase